MIFIGPESGTVSRVNTHLPYADRPRGCISKSIRRRAGFLYSIVISLGAMASSAAADEDAEWFTGNVLPILTENCLDCHSHVNEIKGGLSMDFRGGIVRGGFSGPAIDEKNPKESLILKVVRHEIEDLKMPKDRTPLTPDQIAVLEKWVIAGAPDSRKAPDNHVDPRDHWAFQPVNRPIVPPMPPESVEEDMNEIDAFIHRGHQKMGVNFAPEAERRVLARRLAFDLTGLPPEPSVVEAFEMDSSPQAYGKLIDQFLSDPGFGERWGRHWLDVARYADTRGYVFQSERRFPYSYTYRDYVIASLNQDKPYNQFLMEQLAADRLVETSGDKSSLAGLGFLTLGRRFLNNKHDIIDDRIDVTTRGLMGLTVVCARCHDHKYDPIPTADYYSLYGVFDSSDEPSEYPLLDFNPNDPKYLEFKAELDRRERESEEFRTTNQRNAIAQARKNSQEYIRVFLESRQKDGSGREDAARQAKLDPGILNRWHELLSNPSGLEGGFWAPVRDLHPHRDAPDFSEHLGKFLTENPDFALAEKLSTTPIRSWDELLLQFGVLLSESVDSGDAALADARAWLESPQAPATISLGEATRLLDVPTQEKIRRLRREVEELIATHPGAPPRGMTLTDRNRPVEPVIFERGSPQRRGRQVPRQFLEILAGPERKPFSQGSGRLEMAKEIASGDNPLTARVFVNRVWGHLMGSHLVGTPSDFGVRSPAPTHPELLDYLAARFMDEGWSVKQLVRTILMSRTYRQQSFRTEPGYGQKDPENTLMWKMNRKRLELEPMRDQILYLADRLNRDFGGLPVAVYEPPFQPRRSIYGFIERQNLPGFLMTFDFASPDTTSPKRFETMVPQQALYLMNNPWIQEQARSFAQRIQESHPENPRAQVNEIFQISFQRSPGTREMDWCLDFLQSGDSAAEPGWTPSDTWTYGTIHLDPESLTTGEFSKFPRFHDNTWKGGREIPDKTIGWALLRRDGGHPGQNPQFAVTRRWTAPVSGTVDIKTRLHHPSDQGDGVRLTIHQSGQSMPLAVLEAFQSSATRMIHNIRIEKGQTIDFVVDCRTNESHDSFGSEFSIELKDSGGQFISTRDFSGPRQKAQPMSPIDQLAQAILMSNEAVFVD